MFDDYTLNVIDTLDSLYLNFDSRHNEKIKEIFEMIGVETLVRGDLFKLSYSEIKLVKETFGTQFTTIECNPLIKDLTDFLDFNKKIEELKEKQKNVKDKYTLDSNTNTNIEICKYKKAIHTSTYDLQDLKDPNTSFSILVDAYEKDNSFIKVNETRLCSSDIIELNKTSQFNSVIEIPTEIKHCYVLYLCNTSIVLDSEYDIPNLLESFSDIKLIDQIENTPFREFLHERFFNSVEECMSVYNTLKNTLPKETVDSVTEHRIKNYINYTYKITDNIESRVKALDFYNKCKKECDFTIDTKRFSDILLKLNLKKKRYQDGIYYYGLESLKKREFKDYNELNSKLFIGLPRDNGILTKEECNELMELQIKERKCKIEIPKDITLPKPIKTNIRQLN
jgi:hypothetical protein